LALRNVFKLPDEILNKKSREVTVFDDKLWVLLDDMYDTLQKFDGVGIAAVQVGILRRAIVIDIGDGLIELINPEIMIERGEQRELEGCLSCPDLWGYVVRPTFVRVKYRNRYGKEQFYEADDLLAIALRHEIDHLNGIMFNDIADEMVDKEEAEAEMNRKPSRWKHRRRKKKKVR
jgi:peptide deformylase